MRKFLYKRSVTISDTHQVSSVSCTLTLSCRDAKLDPLFKAWGPLAALPTPEVRKAPDFHTAHLLTFGGYISLHYQQKAAFLGHVKHLLSIAKSANLRDTLSAMIAPSLLSRQSVDLIAGSSPKVYVMTP